MDDHTGGPGDAAADEPAGPSGPDPFDVVFDEDFVRAARTKEPSARARMLTERFKQLEAEHAAQVRAAAAEASQAAAAPAAPSEYRERTYLWPRNLLIACLAGIMALALIGLPRLHSAGEGSDAATTPAPKAVFKAAPGSSPTATASLGVLTGAITTAIAFPDSSVDLEPNLVLERVATARQIPCDTFASQQMSDVIDQGSGCAQLITALYTTSDDKAQFTIDVLTMNRPEDAATIYGLAKSMSMTYQMGSMDPPVGSPVPTVPAGNAGVTDCVMAVRSLVFVNAQWLDPDDQDATTLTADSDSLLHYVDAKVSTYESGQPKT